MLPSKPALIYLKKAIELKCGFPLSSFKDAQEVSEMMHGEGLNVSPHTVGRLFGIVGPFRSHYRYTFDLFAAFVGFPDWLALDKAVLSGEAKGDTDKQNGLLQCRLELSLMVEDHGQALEVMEECEGMPENMEYWRMATVLGQYVRHMDTREVFLERLAHHPGGRRMMFETFVDEDDPQGYFSNALQQHYYHDKLPLGKRLFVSAFLASKLVYAGQAMPGEAHFLKKLNLAAPDLHVQERSRLLEFLFLDRLENLDKAACHQLLDKILELAEGGNGPTAYLIMARVIRAFAFHKQLPLLAQHSEFMRFLIEANVKRPKVLFEAADFTIQAFLLSDHNRTIWAADLKPVSLEGALNERQHVVLLNLLSGYFLAPTAQRMPLQKQLVDSSRILGKRWVEGFLV